MTLSNNTFKKSQIPVILAFIHATFIFAPLYVFVADMAKLTGADLFRCSIRGAFVLIPVVLSHIMLRKINRMSVYIIISMLLTACFTVLGFMYGNYFYYGNILIAVLNCFVCLVVFLMRNYSKIEHIRMRKEFYELHDDKEQFLLSAWEIDTFLSKPSIYHMGWFTIVYVFGVLFKLHHVIYEMFYIVVADIFICFICAYINNFYSYLQLNNKVASMPVNTMKKVNKLMLAIGVVLLILFALPAVIYNKEPLENFSLPERELIKAEMTPEEMGYMANMPLISPEMEKLLESAEQEEAPAWVRYLIEAFIAIMGIVAAVFLAIVIIQGILERAKNYQYEDEDEILNLEETAVDKDESISHNFISENLSEKAKIRRKYRKLIKKRTKGKPKKYATPTELEVEADFDRLDGGNELHISYENARYNK